MGSGDRNLRGRRAGHTPTPRPPSTNPQPSAEHLGIACQPAEAPRQSDASHRRGGCPRSVDEEQMAMGLAMLVQDDEANGARDSGVVVGEDRGVTSVDEFDGLTLPGARRQLEQVVVVGEIVTLFTDVDDRRRLGAELGSAARPTEDGGRSSDSGRDAVRGSSRPCAHRGSCSAPRCAHRREPPRHGARACSYGRLASSGACSRSRCSTRPSRSACASCGSRGSPPAPIRAPAGRVARVASSAPPSLVAIPASPTRVREAESRSVTLRRPLPIPTSSTLVREGQRCGRVTNGSLPPLCTVIAAGRHRGKATSVVADGSRG